MFFFGSGKIFIKYVQEPFYNVECKTSIDEFERLVGGKGD
jgi:hypothetical protein